MAKNNRKEKVLHTTQELCPVADVTKEGIIITKSSSASARYMRILKFTPINFSLLSAQEKDRVIDSFASLLRVLPPKTHIKIMSRHTDTTEQLRVLKADIDKETIPQCRQLQWDQAEQIANMGIYGVQTDFYLIYHYNHEGTARPVYEDVVQYMDDQLTVIAGAMSRCGNTLIWPRNKSRADVQLEYLYTVFSRSQAEEKPFAVRKAEVLSRTIEQIGLNAESIVLSPADLVSPGTVNDRFSSTQIKVDDLYYSYLYVPSRYIPDVVPGGWLSAYVARDAGIDLDLFLEQIPPSKVRQKLRIAQNVNESNWRRAAERNDPSQYDLERLVESGARLQAQMSGGDKFYTFGLMVTFSHRDRTQLTRLVKRFMAEEKGRSVEFKYCAGRQKEAFLSSLPLVGIDQTLWKAMRRNALASDAASAYPFISSVINDPGGIFIGRNISDGSLVFLNPFDTSVYTNANMTILGMAGAGKSVLLKCLAMRSRIAHVQTYVIAPEKGHEFILPVQAVGGTLIRLGPGYTDTINILDIRKANFERQKKIFGDTEDASLMMQKCEQVQIFFTMIRKEGSLTSRERTVLDAALVDTYKKFGITQDNQSLVDPRNPSKFKRMPILKDLDETLKDFGEEAVGLREDLGRFVAPTGSATFLNRETNVDLNNQFVVIDLSNIRQEDLVPIAMFVALDFLWSDIKDDPSKRKLIAIDEVWKLLGEDAPEQCSKFVTKIFKLIRSLNGSAVAATQNLNGFFSRHASASDVINNSQISFLLKTKSSEVDILRSTFGLTKIEADQLTQFSPGQALMVAGQVRALISVETSQMEYDIVTTDPNDTMRRVEAK